MHATVGTHFSSLRRNLKHLSSRAILHPPIQPNLFAAQPSTVRQNMSQLMAVLWNREHAGKSSFLSSSREEFPQQSRLSPAHPPSCAPRTAPAALPAVLAAERDAGALDKAVARARVAGKQIRMSPFRSRMPQSSHRHLMLLVVP